MRKTTNIALYMGKQPEYTQNIDFSLLFTLALHAHFGAICVLREAGVRYWQRVRQAGEIDTALGPRCTQLEHPECGAARATATTSSRPGDSPHTPMEY